MLYCYPERSVFTIMSSMKKARLSERQSIPLMGFGTYDVYDHSILLNAFKIGYRHFDLAQSYRNLKHVKAALTIALQTAEEGGLGIPRDEIWLTMKVNTFSFKWNDEAETSLELDGITCLNPIRWPSPEEFIRSLLAEVGTEYFDLVLYHHPEHIFHSKETLIKSWRMMADLTTVLVRRVGVSNFYITHITRLLEICEECNLKKPFANEIQINPYIYQSERE